ncbi:hypothetical protein HMPREF0083_00082 [Aneurinibacillus aneurinilyticus ATCC 12856]|uniref:Uncharacterized protein n=1 Tax=Aneurinibacillus aneurinilyticus ATCC 12856 TaxID=649747 RepID=U1XBB1_ANEAE|nr:hypothetical protein HMPREF0083_00082 [Aneurinibacillus aneurinilyticus ATCC 12856]
MEKEEVGFALRPGRKKAGVSFPRFRFSLSFLISHHKSMFIHQVRYI